MDGVGGHVEGRRRVPRSARRKGRRGLSGVSSGRVRRKGSSTGLDDRDPSDGSLNGPAGPHVGRVGVFENR